MDALFLLLASADGARVGQIKLIFCLLVAYPLGTLFACIPSTKPDLRHLFNIGVAALFLFPVLQRCSVSFHMLGSIVATYYIAKYDKSPRMPWIVFVIVMGHLAVSHGIHADYGYSYETMEVVGPQMVLAMKLTTFAWNVYDGRCKTEDLDKWQLSKRITEYPPLLSFFGYAFYFPGLLIGPYVDFQEYMELINETRFQHPHVKATVKAGRRLPPGRKRAAYKRMLLGLSYLGVFILLGPTYNFNAALKPEFAKYNILHRIAYFQLAGPIERAKFYALWTLTEGASILTGLGFTDIVNGHPQWDGAANVKVMQIEFPSNFKVLLDSWNMKTNIWLRECVYKRVTPKGRKPGNMSIMITSFTSAFRHGFFGGYYLTFLTGGLITAAARLARQNFRPLLLPKPKNPQASSFKSLYDILGTVASIIILNYTAAPYIVSSTEDSIQTWKVLGWYGHIIIVGSLLFFKFGGSKFFMGLQTAYGIITPSKGKRTDDSGVREEFCSAPLGHG